MAKTLIAAEGRTVLTEDGKPWPAEGLPDPGTLFARRRLADGDLIDKPETAEPAAPAEDVEPTKPAPKKPEKPEGAK